MMKLVDWAGVFDDLLICIIGILNLLVGIVMMSEDPPFSQLVQPSICFLTFMVSVGLIAILRELRRSRRAIEAMNKRLQER